MSGKTDRKRRGRVREGKGREGKWTQHPNDMGSFPSGTRVTGSRSLVSGIPSCGGCRGVPHNAFVRMLRTMLSSGTCRASTLAAFYGMMSHWRAYARPVGGEKTKEKEKRKEGEEETGSLHEPPDAKVPIRFSTGTGRLATQLFLVLQTEYGDDALRKCADDLCVVMNCLEASDKFGPYLSDPFVNVEEKKSLLEEITAISCHPITVNFLKINADLGVLHLLPVTITDYFALVGAHFREKLVTITSAQPLPEEKMDRIIKFIQTLELFRDIHLIPTNVVDPSIIGGFIVDVGDYHADASVRTRWKDFVAAIGKPIPSSQPLPIEDEEELFVHRIREWDTYVDRSDEVKPHPVYKDYYTVGEKILVKDPMGKMSVEELRKEHLKQKGEWDPIREAPYEHPPFNRDTKLYEYIFDYPIVNPVLEDHLRVAKTLLEEGSVDAEPWEIEAARMKLEEYKKFGFLRDPQGIDTKAQEICEREEREEKTKKV